MRCAAIHRKLGTHISKVKSLSMDSWSNEQVENMRKVGNIASNKSYNPQNKKAPMTIDVDEADGAMERFIRAKYMNHGAPKRHNTGSTESDDTPPPLPPKTPSRFGIRSASSIFPLGSKAKKAAAARDPSVSPRDVHPQASLHRNKPSQVFGASVQYDPADGDDTAGKLAKLRDMGFGDEQRNALVLKGVGGNMEKTIEALVRLGEGDVRAPPSSLVSARTSSLPIHRSLTPAASTNNMYDAARAGAGVGYGHISPRYASNNNPFDMLDGPPAPPLSSQSTGTLQNKNPYLSTNPFDMPSQQSPAMLGQAFSSPSLVPPSQPLFPHHTGGMAAFQQQQQQQNHQAIYQQQPMTAPLHPHTNYSSAAFSSTQAYQQMAKPAMNNNYNPFFTNQQPQQQQQQPQQQPLSVNTAGAPLNYGGNPFTRSPTRIQSPTLTQIPEQSQQNFYSAPAQGQMNNPFFPQAIPAMQQQQQQQYQQPQQQQQQTQVPQPFGFTQQSAHYMGQAAWAPQRPDNASIMALYNYPQLAPNPFQAQDSGQAQAQSQAQQAQAQAQQGQAQAQNQSPNSLFKSQTFPQAPQQQANTATMSRNPFAGGGMKQTGPSAVQQQPSLVDVTPKHNVSRESMMAVGLEWANGRHSPDAFSSLSARDTR
ncbi:putative GTPase activating protein for Arf-domain-containing protein [Bombardia bombarda]|uniref:GTPase activating protein for Arf-domain-containing protein n=1 Tax=Bombardia bombarda TaxID=252184 RepID=A0AA40CEF6_9PEZI|nr:putative GTPase activating protein for Arf-domain-containing protein [Bombardia bombarda]